MKTFLNELAIYVSEEYSGKLQKIAVVFPSRRAGIFFKRDLAKTIGKPSWSPAVYSMNDFIYECGSLKPLEGIKLVLELYGIYIKYDKQEFDDFYKWGEMMLGDFDIADKFMVNTDRLFRAIEDIKEIEERFEEELPAEYIRFWKSVLNGEEEVKGEFLRIWKILGSVYKEFKNKLIETGFSYEGLAFRKFAEELKTGKRIINFDKIIFAGFNGISKSESEIFTILKEAGKAEIYFDADEYYVNEKKQEAGFFIRKHLKKFDKKESGRFFSDKLINGEKNITFSGTALNSGVAKSSGVFVKELISKGLFNETNTAIVLPDENLLLPVLYSIPEEAGEFNVTMGYPFKYSQVYNLFKILRDLQKNRIHKGGKILFHHKDIEKVLLHPYIKYSNSKFIYDLIAEMKNNNTAYFNPAVIENRKLGEPDIIEVIFTDCKNVFEYIKEIIVAVSGESNTRDKFENEFLYHFYTSINILSESLKEFKIEIKNETIWNMIEKALNGLKVPFSGEPLKGLQVMGLLETRQIDFENVILLSANEGFLPSSGTENSYIPYTLRKVFGMPVKDDEASITAYYFYRLLQRAKNIYIVFNTETETGSKGKSRFIYQLNYELCKVNKSVKIEEILMSPDISFTKRIPVNIDKSDEILTAIENLPNYSASSLSKYIGCPLAFYFSKIAGIEDRKVIPESMDDKDFGSAYHYIMSYVYKDYLNKEIEKNDFRKILESFISDYDNIFSETIKHIYNKNSISQELLPRNLIYKEILKELIAKTITKDSEKAPFKIIGLEKRFERNIKVSINKKLTEVRIKGFVDRIEKKDGTVLIIDYKTGNAKIIKYTEKNKDIFFELLKNGNDNEHTLQALMYAYLFGKDSNEKVNAGMYYLRGNKKGLVEIADNCISDEIMSGFKTMLKEIIEEIGNADIPFVQTENEKTCSWCEYSGICYK